MHFLSLAAALPPTLETNVTSWLIHESQMQTWFWRDTHLHGHVNLPPRH
jgi:hypothetical protein